MTGERTLPGAGLTGYWNLGDSSWKPGMDTNLRAVSALLQLTVKTRTTALPGSPAQGDMHLVPSGAGVSPNQIALYDNGAWVYVAPRLGTRAFVQDESKFYYWSGTAWTVESADASATSLAGDVTGTVGASVVAKIRGVNVSTTAPTSGQVLKYNGTDWAPGTDASGSGGIADAASDGVIYARKNAAWVAINTYDIPLYIPDRPTTGMTAARIVAVRGFTLPASLTGSLASANTGPTASATFTLQKNGTAFATAVFTPGSTNGAFTAASDTTFAAGDVLRVLCPTQDTTLADISITLAGVRT